MFFIQKLIFLVTLHIWVLHADAPKPVVVLDGRIWKGTQMIEPPVEVKKYYLKQIFPEAPDDAVLFYSGMTQGSFTRPHSKQTIVFCRWEGSPHVTSEVIVEWRAGVFTGSKLIRRLSIPSGFDLYIGDPIWSVLDLDNDGHDEILGAVVGCGRSWVLQVQGNKLKLLCAYPLFYDPSAPRWLELGNYSQPEHRFLYSWRISFNGHLPLSRHSFSIDAYQMTEVSSGEWGSWELISSGKKSR